MIVAIINNFIFVLDDVYTIVTSSDQEIALSRIYVRMVHNQFYLLSLILKGIFLQFVG
jgi:hypothetical protein